MICPRSSVISLYMLPLGNIIRKYGIIFHCYADDTQLCISTKPDETYKLSKLTECVKNVKDWMTNNFLLLNSDKTEILLIGPKNSTQNILDYNLQLDGCTVTSSTVKNLGVILESNLSFENHISNVTKTAFFHLSFHLEFHHSSIRVSSAPVSLCGTAAVLLLRGRLCRGW